MNANKAKRNAIMTDALNYIDEDIIAEVVENLKTPLTLYTEAATVPTKKSVIRSLKYVAAVAAVALLLNLTIPVVQYVTGTLNSWLPGGWWGDTTAEETTAEEKSEEETTADETTDDETTEEETAGEETTEKVIDEETTAEETTTEETTATETTTEDITAEGSSGVDTDSQDTTEFKKLYLQFDPELEPISPEVVKAVNDANYRYWHGGLLPEDQVKIYGEDKRKKFESLYEMSKAPSNANGYAPYYGTFNGSIVYATISPNFPGSARVELAGYSWGYHQAANVLVYNNGKIYTIEDAYEKGYLTDKDIATIAERHEKFEEYIGGDYSFVPKED